MEEKYLIVFDDGENVRNASKQRLLTEIGCIFE